MSGQLIGYARVSTRRQEDLAQVDQLTTYGCSRVFADKVSGRTDARENWQACLAYLRTGDTLVVTRLARLGRSTRNVLNNMHTLTVDRGIDLVALHQNIDTRTATGKFMTTVLVALDELTADLIREQTLEGLAAARARGRIGGRPRVLDEDAVKRAQQLREAGDLSMEEIARAVGCSRTTLYRTLGISQ